MSPHAISPWPAEALYEAAVRRGEATIGRGGALVVKTGIYTGRLPKDKFIVRESSSQAVVDWGDVNRPFDEEAFERLENRVRAHLENQETFSLWRSAGADPRYCLPVQLLTESPWHALFIHHLLRDPVDVATPPLNILHAPSFKANPQVDGTRSESFILLHPGRRLVLIGGTAYAGEIKKAVFTFLNYHYPEVGILPMHCAANTDLEGKQTALFFGLSGTGKTTLSADSSRELIGDDEHGWNDRGIFNFEGGCYAKVIRLSPEGEPEIYATTRQFGTVLENVVIDPLTRDLDLNDDSITENTRAGYPLSAIPNASATGMGDHPAHVIFLTCDAFGVLPPVSRLTPEQAVTQFLLGYTAKVAGTERGVTEPTATFSPCFGAPFMVRSPEAYARLLKTKLDQHGANIWLVNTGWSGGPAGVAQRMPLAHTRAIVRAIVTGQLNAVPTTLDPVFGLAVPNHCPDVPVSVLQPRNAWADPGAYDQQAAKLKGLFEERLLAHSRS